MEIDMDHEIQIDPAFQDEKLVYIELVELLDQLDYNLDPLNIYHVYDLYYMNRLFYIDIRFSLDHKYTFTFTYIVYKLTINMIRS